MIGVIDYEIGNLRSVQRALEHVGGQVVLVRTPDELARADKIVLPGVAAFKDAMDQLRRQDLVDPLVRAIETGTPYLGFCLGLQLLFDVSYEDGRHTGLGVLASYLTVNFLPFDSYRVVWDRVQLVYFALYYLSLALPFFFSGLAVGGLLATRPALTSRIYAANLAGSAAGCLIALGTLPLLGGAGAVLFSAVLGGVAAAVFARRQKWLRWGYGTLVAGLLSLIGHTPVVRLNRVLSAEAATVWAKLEKHNPGGSVKDRIALNMILDAEESGKLKPGGTIVEPTSGNTGVGLAMVGAARGYHVILVMPDSMSAERRLLMQAYGAELVLTPGAQSMRGSLEMP